MHDQILKLIARGEHIAETQTANLI